MIPVTKTFLPPKLEYQAILDRAWNTGWITNRGVLVRELEEKLKNHLGVPNLIAATNGTIALQIAIKALGLSGEIITTPFSYVATTSSIVWENCTPVFVDIHADYLTIDETKIEASINSKTSAIVATHVFGNPCEVEVIEKIAKKHDLKVIYDAAHCFGVTYKGTSIFNYGDVSICSFHATKIFHTGEGGGMITKDPDLHHKLYYHHNFGHKGQEDFEGLGINAKMSEFQAAMGLAVLPYIDEIVSERKRVVNFYRENFPDFKTVKIREGTSWNYSYYPILFENEKMLLKVKKKLEEHQIFPRRYFYPGLNSLNYVTKTSLPLADLITKSILCLPVFHGLESIEMGLITKLINESAI